MTTSQIKSLFKIMAHFDHFSYPAKETLEGHIIDKSDGWSLADLSDVVFSLPRLRTPNHTLLAIIQKKVIDQANKKEMVQIQKIDDKILEL